MIIRITVEIDGRRIRPLWWLRYVWMPRRGGRVKSMVWIWWYNRELKRGVNGEVCMSTEEGPCYIPTMFGEAYCTPHWNGNSR